MAGRKSRQYRCPACRADLVLVNGYPPTPRFAVFACGSMESRIGGRYSFTQAPGCVALSEEDRSLDDPGAFGA